ncbi:MAG: response regulator [Synergistaceae bacterium]|nr:response regulator [Synergistaceae bacterium]
MRQFNFEYMSQKDAIAGLADVKRALEGEQTAGRCNDALLLIFLTGFMEEDAREFLRAVDVALPNVKRVGITGFAGTAFCETGHYIKLNLTTAARSSFHTLQVPCKPNGEQAAAKALSDFLDGIEDVRGVAIFPANIALNVTAFLEAASEGREELPFFGAMAYGKARSWYGDIVKGSLFSIGEKLLESGFTAVVFAGKDLNVIMDYILGWHPIGRELSVKLGEKSPYGETTILEIDGRPAAELYKKYLGVNWDENFMWNTCEFPLMVRRNGADICLVPMTKGGEGELYFSGALKGGETLRLSYGTRGDILGASWAGSQRMRAFAPESVMLFLCGNRVNYFKEDAHMEWDYYREHFPQLIYCHGHGEIAWQNQKGGVLNSSFVAVGFREGPVPAFAAEIETCDGNCRTCRECEECKEARPPVEDGLIPLPYRMARFLMIMTNELEEMTVRAEAANKAKSAFLSNMSHEIRTPINAVLGMDEMILREATEKNVLEYAGNIRTAGNSLLGLINDILDFSKIEAGKMDIIPVEYEMASVLNDLANMIAKRAEDKGLKLTVEAAPDIPSSLRGDELRLKQVVINILTNAVKYTQQGSVTFRVGCERDGEAAVLSFSVTDTGIGIKEEDMARLFSPFERLDEGRNHSVEGTGLGMAITTQILSKMGSKLEVQSVYGEGSTFSFKVRQEIVNPEPMGDFQEVFRRSLANRAEYRESFHAPEAHVLAVDDMFINLAVFRGLLKRTEVRVDTAQSGEECLAKLTKNAYDIIFLDHRMPGMDGVETFRRMKDLPGNKNLKTPVIALTANAVSGAKEEYQALGFAGYLSKPTDAAALEKLLKRTLPPEKVQPVIEAQDTGAKGAETDEDELPQVEGLDWGFAELHLPSRELLAGALRDFYAAITPHADKLDGFYHALPDTWDDYRVLVHGMKSSAATVGVIPLAGMAKVLEYAARDKDLTTVSALHGPFLREWRSYQEKLKGVFGLGSEGKGEEKTAFDAKSVHKLLETIRDAAEDFDTDAADEAMEKLGTFALPTELTESFAELRAAENDVDADSVIRIAEEMLTQIKGDRK